MRGFRRSLVIACAAGAASALASAGLAIAAPPNDPLFAKQWNLGPQGIDLVAALDAVPGGVGALQRTRVAVLDTGIDDDHTDIAGRLWSPAAGETGPITGRVYGGAPNAGSRMLIPGGSFGWYLDPADANAEDGIGQDGIPRDQDGISHGSAVSGIIAAGYDNGVGLAGVAPNVELLPVETCGGGDTCYPTTQATALRWAADRARIVSLSYSLFAPDAAVGANRKDADGNDTDTLPEIYEAIRDSPQTLFVAVTHFNAGDAGGAAEEPRPCVYGRGVDGLPPLPNVLCVTGHLPERTRLHQSGEEVHIAAPSGVSGTSSGICSIDKDGGYITNGNTMTGTGDCLGSGPSVAGPHVAGVAAVLLGRYPQATIPELKQAILEGAETAPGLGIGEGALTDRVLDAPGAMTRLGALVGATGADPVDPQSRRTIRSDEAIAAAGALQPVTTAVIDTGVDIDHSDLARRVVSLPAGIVPASSGAGYPFVPAAYRIPAGSRGWDLIGENEPLSAGVFGEHPDEVPTDLEGSGHGTAVAGVIGAQEGNGQGVRGVAPNVRLLPLRACWTFGSVFCYQHVVGEAARLAGRAGARVANLSFGLSADSAQARAGIEATPDVLFVVSGGNSPAASNADTSGDVNGPCTWGLANVLCISGTDQAGGLVHGYGPTNVPLAAPTGTESTTRGGGYGGCGATSCATALASGAAALLFGAVPGATVAQVRTAMLTGARIVPQPVGGVTTGVRVLDVRGALAALTGVPEPVGGGATPAPAPGGGATPDPAAPTGTSPAPAPVARPPARVPGLLSSTPFSASGKADRGAAARASQLGVKVAKKRRKGRKLLTISFRVRTDGRKARWSLERAVAKGRSPRFRRVSQKAIGARKRLTRVVLRRTETPGTKLYLRVAVRDSRGRVARTKALRITVPKR